MYEEVPNMHASTMLDSDKGVCSESSLECGDCSYQWPKYASRSAFYMQCNNTNLVGMQNEDGFCGWRMINSKHMAMHFK